jgi:hypothetical protein
MLLRLIGISLVSAACTSEPPPAPIAWNADAGSIVVEVVAHGGYFDRTAHERRIPLRIWGDGTIVWSRQEGSEAVVLTGRLTEAQLRLLLEHARDVGFFGWSRFKSRRTDQGSTCIAIVTIAGSHKVCAEDHSDPPPPWRELIDALRAGAGAEGTPYSPQRGYLVARKRDEKRKPAAPGRRWPADSGVKLASASDGVWLEGAPLATAWKLIYLDQVRSAEEAGTAYDLFLRVAKVTATEPP